MCNKKILYNYVGLPSYWYNLSWENVKITEIRKNSILEKFEKAIKDDKQFNVIIQGQIAPLINTLIDKTSIKSVRGIDFINYFDSMFKDEKQELIFSKYMVVYNVGLEKAINPKYASKILNSLIAQIRDKGGSIFIQTLMNISEFRENYKIDFKSIIKLLEVYEEII